MTRRSVTAPTSAGTPLPTLLLTSVLALLLTLGSLLGLALPAAAATSLPRGDTRLTLPGGTRAYVLHVSGTTPRPLVMVLHGWRDGIGYTQRQTGFSRYGDGHGFNVVYPSSARGSAGWNAGGCCGYEPADDVAFLSAVLADVRLRVPTTQAYVVGFSNGGMMALRLACQTTLFAGAASVSGPLLVPCRHRIHALHLQGVYDGAVPLAGGFSHYTRSRFPASLPQRSIMTVRTFRGGHQWPQGATAQIWNFLKAPAARR